MFVTPLNIVFFCCCVFTTVNYSYVWVTLTTYIKNIEEKYDPKSFLKEYMPSNIMHN